MKYLFYMKHNLSLKLFNFRKKYRIEKKIFTEIEMLKSFILSYFLLMSLSTKAMSGPIDSKNYQKAHYQLQYPSRFENHFDQKYQYTNGDLNFQKRVDVKRYYRSVVDSILNWFMYQQKKVSKQELVSNQHWYVQFGK